MKYKHKPSQILLEYFLTVTPTDEDGPLLKRVLEPHSHDNENPEWYGFHSKEPDSDYVGDNVVTFYTTTPLQDGRLMVGETIQHPGVQIRVRSTDDGTGYRKIAAFEPACDAIHRHTVTLENEGGESGTTAYLIHAVSRASGILPLGSIPNQDLFIHTINFTMTIAVIG